MRAGCGATRRPGPVGWVVLTAGYTIRWRRGDQVAAVLRGEQLDSQGSVVDTIPVPKAGWTDLVEIRQLGQRWLTAQKSRQRRNQQSESGQSHAGRRSA